jgi:hypothetical protein
MADFHFIAGKLDLDKNLQGLCVGNKHLLD